MGISGIDGLLKSFQGKKVLVIGDVMVDTYIKGNVSRISPEAPVPIMLVSSRENRLGGAANVAMNLQELGAEPLLCSIIGDDLAAETFMSLMASRNLMTGGIIKSQKRMTTIKNRLISGSQHLIRIDEENDRGLDPIDQKGLESHILNLLEQSDLVIFEDYDKGCLNEHVIQETISNANKRGIPTAVDPKSRNFLFYRKCTLFKPNLRELNEGLKLNVSRENLEDVREAAKKLRKQLQCENIMITLSDHGIYYHNKKLSGHATARHRIIADVSGAGDTVISVAALALSEGISLDLVSALSNLAGGMVCEFPGVVPIKADEFETEIGRDKQLMGLL